MKNKDALQFNLLQVKDETEKLIELCKSEKLNDAGPYVLGQSFATIMNYLCNAWYYRELSGSEIIALSQDDYERYSTLIPNFCFKFKFDEKFDFQLAQNHKSLNPQANQ